jgi:HEAT repeat protein
MHEPDASDEPAAEKALVGISSGDASARVAAIREVAQIGLADSGRSIPAVVKALDDPDASVRAQAAQSLGILGSYVVWARMTGNADGAQDEAAFDAAIKALLGAMASDTQALVRSAAAEGLGNISATSPPAPRPRGSRKGEGDKAAEAQTPSPSPVDYPAVVTALIAALGDKDGQVRASVASALGAAGPKVSEEPPPPLVAALKDESSATRAATAKALSRFSRGVDQVLAALIPLSAKDDVSVRQACVQALRDIKPSALSAAAIPALVEGLKSSDRDIRFFAVRLLARFGPEAKDAVPNLIAVLNEPLGSDQSTAGGGRAMVTIFTGPAQEAAIALGKIAPGTPRAAESIAALARIVSAGPRQRRASAANALGEFAAKAAPAIPDLVKMLEVADSDDALSAASEREAGVKALARVAADSPSSEAVVSVLRHSLRSDSKKPRASVVTALGQLGPKAAVAAPEIEALKNNPDPNVRKAATRALEDVGQH